MHRRIQLFIVLVALVGATMTGTAKAFDEPTDKMRLDAIGDTKSLSKAEQAAFSPRLDIRMGACAPARWARSSLDPLSASCTCAGRFGVLSRCMLTRSVRHVHAQVVWVLSAPTIPLLLPFLR